MASRVCLTSQSGVGVRARGCFSLLPDPKMSPDLGHKLDLSPVTKISTQAQTAPHPGSGLGYDGATHLPPLSVPDIGSALKSCQSPALEPRGEQAWPGVGWLSTVHLCRQGLRSCLGSKQYETKPNKTHHHLLLVLVTHLQLRKQSLKAKHIF